MENKTPEEIIPEEILIDQISNINEILPRAFRHSAIIKLIKQYGKQQYKQDIKDAAEKAKVMSIYQNHIENEFGEIIHFDIDKDSMKKLLKQ